MHYIEMVGWELWRSGENRWVYNMWGVWWTGMKGSGVDKWRRDIIKLRQKTNNNRNRDEVTGNRTTRYWGV